MLFLCLNCSTVKVNSKLILFSPKNNTHGDWHRWQHHFSTFWRDVWVLFAKLPGSRSTSLLWSCESWAERLKKPWMTLATPRPRDWSTRTLGKCSWMFGFGMCGFIWGNVKCGKWWSKPSSWTWGKWTCSKTCIWDLNELHAVRRVIWLLFDRILIESEPSLWELTCRERRFQLSISAWSTPPSSVSSMDW